MIIIFFVVYLCDVLVRTSEMFFISACTVCSFIHGFIGVVVLTKVLDGRSSLVTTENFKELSF